MIRRLDVRYKPQARSDLDEIFWYIAVSKQNPKAALDYVNRIDERCQRIGDAPRSGRLRSDLLVGLRTIPFEGSVLICYEITNEAIWITNVFRRGRDIDAIFGAG
jgi:toxin ParE1/3/4